MIEIMNYASDISCNREIMHAQDWLHIIGLQKYQKYLLVNFLEKIPNEYILYINIIISVNL